MPFYRAHAHIDTKRREPYLYSSDVQNRIRTALKARYAHLPLWYTLFWEHARSGDPVVRPIFYHYPEDVNALDVDYELLVGHSVLVRPVVESAATSASVYLPGGSNEIWYDIDDFKAYYGNGHITVPVNMDKVPVYYRGGAIIPRKDRARRASSLTHHDPYTLYVALDSRKSASGTLYIDDFESFEYKTNKYLYLRFDFKENKLSSSRIDEKADYKTNAWLERVVILGPPSGVTSAKITSKCKFFHCFFFSLDMLK